MKRTVNKMIQINWREFHLSQGPKESVFLGANCITLSAFFHTMEQFTEKESLILFL